MDYSNVEVNDHSYASFMSDLSIAEVRDKQRQKDSSLLEDSIGRIDHQRVVESPVWIERLEWTIVVLIAVCMVITVCAAFTPFYFIAEESRECRSITLLSPLYVWSLSNCTRSYPSPSSPDEETEEDGRRREMESVERVRKRDDKEEEEKKRERKIADEHEEIASLHRVKKREDEEEEEEESDILPPIDWQYTDLEELETTFSLFGLYHYGLSRMGSFYLLLIAMRVSILVLFVFAFYGISRSSHTIFVGCTMTSNLMAGISTLFIVVYQPTIFVKEMKAHYDDLPAPFRFEDFQPTVFWGCSGSGCDYSGERSDIRDVWGPFISFYAVLLVMMLSGAASLLAQLLHNRICGEERRGDEGEREMEMERGEKRREGEDKYPLPEELFLEDDLDIGKQIEMEDMREEDRRRVDEQTEEVEDISRVVGADDNVVREDGGDILRGVEEGDQGE